MADTDNSLNGKGPKRDLHEYGTRLRTDGPYADNLDLDVLVVGAGFAGTYLLYETRKAGFNTVLYDAGASLGGTWRWNIYPGAGVDSEVPIYQFSIPEVWQTWNWTTNYPDFTELQAYFEHVDKVLDLSKDCAFRTVVTSAEFDVQDAKWKIQTADGRSCKARFFVVAAGMSAKRYLPDFAGLERFQGEVHHSSFWPETPVPIAGKRTAVIGTGASGVQIIQEWAHQAQTLTVFQRTPNTTLPKRQRALTKEEQDASKPFYPEIFALRERCFAGFHYDFLEKTTFAHTPAERDQIYEALWNKPGFHFWLAAFKDYLTDPAANRCAYDFWARKQRARITDPIKRDLLCPLEPRHPFGVKRPALENGYYEALDRENVEIVDISKESGNGIMCFTENGIRTVDGRDYDLDVVALATGFDVVSGGITNMGLKSTSGTLLRDEWRTAANTYLGTTITGYPNLFQVYGVHGPTLLCNRPSCTEVQGRWVRDVLVMMQRQGIKSIEATEEATRAWKGHIDEMSNATLLPTTRSTYMGGGLPGKPFEQLNYVGGLPAYHGELRAVLPEWKGFTVVHA